MPGWVCTVGQGLVPDRPPWKSLSAGITENQHARMCLHINLCMLSKYGWSFQGPGDPHRLWGNWVPRSQRMGSSAGVSPPAWSYVQDEGTRLSTRQGFLPNSKQLSTGSWAHTPCWDTRLACHAGTHPFDVAACQGLARAPPNSQTHMITSLRCCQHWQLRGKGLQFKIKHFQKIYSLKKMSKSLLKVQSIGYSFSRYSNAHNDKKYIRTKH